MVINLSLKSNRGIMKIRSDWRVDKYTEERLNKLEVRQEKLEEKVNTILQEISSFKPILSEINKNIERLSENSVDRERVVNLENKVNDLEHELTEETINKKAKLLEDIIKGIILAIIGATVGFFIKK